MSITSENNIRMLKQLLEKHPLLKINKNEFDHVFNREISRIHQDRFSYRSNLIEMNKELLKTFQRLSIEFKKDEAERIKKEELEKQTMHEKFMRQRRIEKRREQQETNFEQRLSDTRNEFNKVMAGNRPTEIDFSDKVQDIPIKSNQVDLTMSQREAELAEIMRKQPKNKKFETWLQGENNNKPMDNINLKIDHSSNVHLNTEPIPGKPIRKKITRNNENRRVRFHVDEQEQQQQTTNNVGMGLDFFQKLKLKNELNQQTNIFNDEIKDILKTIRDNQLTIIQELKTMNLHFLKNMERNDKIYKVENKVSEIVEEEYDTI